MYVLSLEEYMQIECGSESSDDDDIVLTQTSLYGTTQRNKKRTQGVPTLQRKAKRPLVDDNDSNSDADSDNGDHLDIIDAAAMSDEEEGPNNDKEDDDDDEFYTQIKRFSLNGIEFDRQAQGSITEAQFKEKSPLGILLHLYGPIMTFLVSANRDTNRLYLSIEECFTYHAMMVYMSVIKLNTFKDYWNDDHPLVQSKFPFNKYMSLRRFHEIRANIRTYLASDENNYPGNKAWKVRNIFDMLKRAFMLITKAPGEFLSMDESMFKFTGSRNPIKVVIPGKPNNGIRVFMIVDYWTKIVLNMILDDKSDNAENCKEFAGGFTGRKVTELVISDQGQHYFRGTGRTILTDNYYGSIDLARYLRTIGYNYISTLRRKRSPIVRAMNAEGEDEGIDTNFYPKGKNCRPTQANPRGTLRTALGPNESKEVGLYSWMDNANVLFIDTKYGTEDPVIIERRVGSDTNQYNVPQAIKVYNDNMGGVDQHDQMRDNYFRFDEHRTSKWTIRVFENLFAMAITNAYCIYRANHEPNSDKHLTHPQFMETLCSEFFNHEHCKRQRSKGPLTRRQGNEVAVNNSQHFKVQTAKGTRGGNDRSRRFRLRCRFPGCTVKTSYYCSACRAHICEDHFEQFNHQKPPQPYDEEEDDEDEG